MIKMGANNRIDIPDDFLENDMICRVCREIGKYIIILKSCIGILFNNLSTSIYSIALYFYMIAFHFKAPELVKKVLYYGAVCCASCKGFFRRATKNCQHSKFTCNSGFNLIDRANEKSNGGSNPIDNGQLISAKKTPQCGVDVKTRRQCQYCRYKRCQAGNLIFGLF